MRNLKRALSLALAAIMLLGMMVVGASAVSYNDFSDRTEIVNKDAVSMLTTLGVIDGKPDGSYAPEEFVTREQMAKMISVIMNQGSDNNDLFVGVPSGLTDVAGNWALGHINYCYSLGIIAGRGDGRFDPTANVTAAEAAKMLLVAAGYNPASEGFVGGDWSINVNAKASALGIFRNYTKSTMADLNRDDAALLIYNALDVEMIQKYEDGYAIAFQDHRTILSAMYGVYKVEGVVVANKWAQLQETGVDAALREGRTTLEDVIVYSSTTNNTTTGEGVREREPVTFNVDTTVDMMGKMVTLYIEKTTILSNSKVLGVSLKDDINHVETTAATKDTIDGYLKGTGIAADKDTGYYVNYGWCKDGGTEASDKVTEYAIDVMGKEKFDENFNLNGVSVEVIDNNNDGVAEYVLYRIETLSQVNRYNDKAETVTLYQLDRDKSTKALKASASTFTVDFDDMVAEDELAADDVVLYIQYGGRTYIKLADYVTDTMTRVDRDTNKELYITVGGEQYRQSYIPDAASLVDPDIEHFDIDEAREMPGFDKRYDFFLDSTGEYVVAVRPAEKSEANYALVLESAWTLNALKRDGQVKILKTDGTKGTYYIDWDDSADAFKGVTAINYKTQYDKNGDGTDDTLINGADKDTKLELYLGTRDVNISGSGGTGSGGYTKINTARGSVIRYSIDADDMLTIEWVMQNNTFVDTTTNANGREHLAINNEWSSTSAKSTAGVGDGGAILYLLDYRNGTNQNNLQYALDAAYANGDGTLQVKGTNTSGLNGAAQADRTGEKTKFAVDLDTIGFYYDAANDDYGVAVGWDDMSDVGINTEVQVYPVLDKQNNGTYKASKLAGVILFEAPTSAITADYFLVLGANAASSGNNWHLTVVFEDGTVDEVTVKKANLGDFKPTKDEHFYQAWSYSEQADGTYKLGTMYKGHNVGDSKDLLESGGKGIAYNLSNQTFALERECLDGANSSLLPYVAYGKDFNIWDVTEVEFASDTTTTGKFSSTRVHAVVIEDKNTLRTAWIWDMEDDDPYVPGTVNKDILVKIVSDTVIEVELNDGDMKDRAAAVIAKLTEEGYTNISVKANGTELDVTASKTINNVTQETVFTTKTYKTTKAIGGTDVKSVLELDRNSDGYLVYTPGTYVASGEQIQDLTASGVAHPDWYPAGDTLLTVAFNGPLTGGTGYIIFYNKDGAPVFLSSLSGVTVEKTYAYNIAINDSSRHYGSLNSDTEGVWTADGSGIIYTSPGGAGYVLPDGDYTWAVKEGAYTNAATDAGKTAFASGSFTVEW